MSDAKPTDRGRHPIPIAAIALARTAIVLRLATSRTLAAGLEAVPSPQATGNLLGVSDLMIAQFNRGTSGFGDPNRW
jgi:hypothetical protein